MAKPAGGNPGEARMSKHHRRRFIQESLLLLGGVSVASCDSGSPATASSPSKAAAPPSRSEEKPEQGAPTDRSAPGGYVADLDEIPENAACIVSFQGQPVVVLNDAGTIRALSGICTHEQCEVEWRADLRLLQCPCHDGRYDRSGKVISGPPPSPLREFEVVVEAGRVYLVSAG